MTGKHFSGDIRAFVKLLASHGVRYLLVGGEAVIHHGYARLTGAVDFFYDQSGENVQRLHAALLDFWGGSIPSIQGAEDLAVRGVIVQFGRPPNRIDLISELGSVLFDGAWSRRVEDVLEDGSDRIPLQIIGRDDLLQSKRDAGRPKDLDDIENLSQGPPES